MTNIFERGYFNSTKIEKSLVTESLEGMKNFSASNIPKYKPTVFLSHKHSDLEDLQGVIGLLNDYGAKVYIDSMDNKLPNQTSGETAKRIKEVIKGSKKFILLATENAIESYWCNWELGIGDTHKYINNIAIIAMKEKGDYDFKYKGNEYLEIYPCITYYDSFTNLLGDFFPSGYYYKKPPNDKGFSYITELKEWLES